MNLKNFHLAIEFIFFDPIFQVVGEQGQVHQVGLFPLSFKPIIEILREKPLSMDRQEFSGTVIQTKTSIMRKG